MTQIKHRLTLRVGQLWNFGDSHSINGKETWYIIETNKSYSFALCIEMERQNGSTVKPGFIWKVPKKFLNDNFPGKWTRLC